MGKTAKSLDRVGLCGPLGLTIIGCRQRLYTNKREEMGLGGAYNNMLASLRTAFQVLSRCF